MDAWSRLNKISANIQVKSDRRISGEVEQALFRVTQEALSNIVRHSLATQVELALVYEGDNVILTISDNGTGFDVISVEDKGVGLRSMSERMQALGGEFKVESSQGHGTRIIAQCPLKERHSNE